MKEQCETLIKEIQGGIDWTCQNLEREQGQTDIVQQLKEARRRGRRMVEAAAIRPSVGVFGASQHGKSYLVSNMVRMREDSPLEVVLPPDHESVDFERKMNPAGGQESTGAVTRFTIHDDCPSGQPGIQVELLTQWELAALLAHGYLANVHKDGMPPSPDIEALQTEVNRLAEGAGSTERDGLSEDDIFDLRDYLEQHLPKDSRISELRRIGYWEQVATVAPRLESGQRAELFAWLWERVPAITDMYRKLVSGLEKLGHPRFAATDKDSVMPKTDSMSKPRTILDVRVVVGLAQESNLDPVNVTSESGMGVSMDRAVFTALIKEVVLPIPAATADHDHLKFLEHADVLDFPGARPPQTIAPGDLEPGVEKHVLSMKEIFVRGKVSFLFASYDTDFRVTTLLIGQKDGNVDVKELPLLSYDWIARNIGASAEERQSKANRFFMVFTFWNQELEKQADSPEEHGEKWQARLAKNFAEEWQYAMDQDKWIQEWTPGKPYRNCYFVRDPRFSNAVFTTSTVTGLEEEVQPHRQQQMEMMRESFVNSPIVREHVQDPERMWEESATPNRNGTHYLLEGVTGASSPDDKVEQISTQLRRQRQEVLSVLRSMHHDEDAAAEKQKAEKNARAVGGAVMKVVQKGMLGILLERLYLPEEVAWSVYYNVENPAIRPDDAEGETLEPETPDLGGNMGGLDASDIFDWADDSEQQEAPEEKAPSKESRLLWNKADAYADELLDRWFASLTDLIDDEDFLHLVGLDVEAARLLVNGVKDAARRRQLRERIRDCVRPGIESAHSNLQIELYSRLTSMEINAFLNDFDWSHFPEQDRPTVKLPQLGEEVPVFRNIMPETPKLEELNLDEKSSQVAFPLYWIQGLYSALVANADEVTFDVEANRELGQVIQRVEAIS